jgi:glycine betaine/choline ABC-type transport system substrate-binding protein
MSTQTRLRAMFALLAALVLSFGVAACGDDDDDGGDSAETESSSTLIESNPDNEGVAVTVGSKNFTEQIVLGEIYAQALEAAGYDVSTQLNLGSEQVALKALEDGEIDAYPEYTSTALTAFFELPPEEVPGDPQQAFEESEDDFAELGLTAYPPTPFSSANAVGVLTSTAEELGLSSISDLEAEQDELVLAGSPECRQRIDCLAGLEEYYGLDGLRANFTPVDIGLRYEVLDKGDADLSILFTTDAQLATSEEYTLLEDDQGVLPAGNILFVATEEIVEEAGPDFGETVEKVQEGLTLEVMQELNSRVDVDREEPSDVAAAYLQESGYIE